MGAAGYSSTTTLADSPGLGIIPGLIGPGSGTRQPILPSSPIVDHDNDNEPNLPDQHPRVLWNPAGDAASIGGSFERDEDCRHWSPESQVYASADVLLQRLQGGWEIDGSVMVEVFRCVSRQYVEVYCFKLARGDEVVCMPVIANPAVLRLVKEHELPAIGVCTDLRGIPASQLMMT